METARELGKPIDRREDATATKPKVILDYNLGAQSDDVSDQMSCCVRRATRDNRKSGERRAPLSTGGRPFVRSFVRAR